MPTYTATSGTGQKNGHPKGESTQDEHFVLNYEHITGFSHGHHARGETREYDTTDQSGTHILSNDIFDLSGLDLVDDVVVGRLEDYDFSRDEIYIEGTPISKTGLEIGYGTTGGYDWKIVKFDADENDSAQGTQQWIVVDTGDGFAFYALEGARVTNGDGLSRNGHQEAHFVGAQDSYKVTAADLTDLPAVGFIDPQNFVPETETTSTGIIYNDYDHDMSDVNDVIEHAATMHANQADYRRYLDLTGDDLIAGGINNDTIKAHTGDDSVWGAAAMTL